VADAMPTRARWEGKGEGGWGGNGEKGPGREQSKDTGETAKVEQEDTALTCTAGGPKQIKSHRTDQASLSQASPSKQIDGGIAPTGPHECRSA